MPRIVASRSINSLIWALLLVVTAKYVLILLRADNDGEGGTLALMALASRALGGRNAVVVLLGIISGALFYGDAIITLEVMVPKESNSGIYVMGEYEVQVLDSGSGEDVTRQVLAQIILEGEKQGRSLLSADLFHDVIRRGEAALQARVEQLQEGVDRLMKASVDHLPPVRDARHEMEALRDGIAGLEAALRDLETGRPSPRGKRARKRTTTRRRRADG